MPDDNVVQPQQLQSATVERLNQFVARIERLEGEKAELAADIREIYSECAAFGFENKIIRKVIAARKKEAAERAEEEALMTMYMEALED